MSKIIIDLPNNFDFKKCLSSLDNSPLEPTHEIGENYLRKLIFIASTPILLEITANNKQLVVKNLTGGKLNVAWKHAIHHQANQWFDLNTDIEPFYKMAKNDAILCKAIEANNGLRMTGIPDLFEALSWAVMSQSASPTFAYRLKRNIVEKFGDSFSFDGKTYYTFPRAEKLAQLKPEQLQSLNFSKRKAEYLIGIAELVQNNNLNKEQLLELPIDQAKEKLMEIRGIGAWTASYALSKCLRHKDSLSLKESNFKKVIKKVLQLSKKPEEQMLSSIENKWAPWRSYATLYLREMA